MPQWELWYFSAFQALPRFFLSDPESFWSKIAKHEGRRALWLLMLLKTSGRAPKLDEDESAILEFHDGTLEDGTEYVVFEYPVPPGVNLTEEQLEQSSLSQAASSIPFLGAYYSVITRANGDRPAACFVLSQSPLAGQTSLRRCTQAGHYNLGIGPEPSLPALLSSLPDAFDRKARGATMHSPELRDETDQALGEGLSNLTLEQLQAFTGSRSSGWYQRLTLPISILLGCVIGLGMYGLFFALGQVKPEETVGSILLTPVLGFFWLRYLADEVHEGRTRLLFIVTSVLVGVMIAWAYNEQKLTPAAGVAYALLFSPIVSGELARLWSQLRGQKSTAG